MHFQNRNLAQGYSLRLICYGLRLSFQQYWPAERFGRLDGRSRWWQTSIARLQLWDRRTEHHSAPGSKHAIVTQNGGVRGVKILNEIGDQAIIANNEAERGGP